MHTVSQFFNEKTKDHDIVQWLSGLGRPAFSKENLDGLRRPVLFAALTFVTGWLPSSEKAGTKA